MNNPTTTSRVVIACASIFVGFIALTVRADYSNTVASFNPLAYWRFNETVISPPLNKVLNSGSLGSTADGYIVFDAAKGEPGALGLLGNSVRLVNNGNTVGYCGSKVDVPYSAALNPVAPFSVEFWAKPNSLGAEPTGFSPISCFNPNFFGGANRSGWLFYLNNTGKWQFRLGRTSGYAVVLDATGITAAAGVWQHVAATYDGTTARIYVNGLLRGSSAVAAGWAPNTQMALRIGGTPLQGNLSDGPAIANDGANGPGGGIAGNRGFDGWMDEVAIYPTELSASTIAAHFAAATTNTAGYGVQILASGPLGYWNMNEPAVTPPDPSTFPIAANSGSVGSAADGTNIWGVLAAQPGAAYPGFGAGNNACFFDGENGYVSLPDVAGLHFSGNITMTAWIKPTVKDFFRDIIAHGWDNNYAETFLRISRGNFDGTGYGDGGNYYELGTSDGSSFYDAAYFPIPEGDIGNWVFLAGTYDGANWNLYRNGALVASVASANGAVDVTNRWSIGAKSDANENPGGSEAFFGGYIDEPAIFSTALSAGDINTLYNAAQVPPVITRHLVSPASPGAPPGILFSGLSASLSVWAEGSPTLDYRWTSNGVTLGPTTTNITLSNLSAGTPAIQVIVTNAYGSATSSLALTVVDSPPLVLQQPKAVTRFAGFPFTFAVTAGGSTPLGYEWKTNGVGIPGATSPTYSGVASAANELNYSCTITNPFGATNSAGAALTALPIPSGYPGAVIASSPRAYWRLGETNGTTAGDYISGHDGTYFSALLNQPGYSVIDPDRAAAFGAVNSYVGDINGDAATGGISFSGHTNFTLEAWVNGPAGQPDESTIIAKGNGASGTTATEQFAIDVLEGKYRFFTRGGGNSLFEADAAVGPNGTWQHVVGVYDDLNMLGAGPQMYIYVNGELSGTGAPRGVGLRTSTSAVTIGSKHLGNDPAFDGFFTGTIDEVSVYPVALSASTIQAHYAAAYGPNLAPVIDVQPQSVTNYVGLPATLSVAAHGTVPLSYQWRKGGTDISGATGSSFTITNATASDDAGNYSVNVANSVLPAGTNSLLAAIRVLAAPTSPPAIPGLVLHLPFDNNLTDATGRGNNGVGIHVAGSGGPLTSNSVAPTFVAGKLGQALHYASDMGSYPGPTTTNNDYVTLGVKPDLQFSSNVNCSVAFWIRLPLNYVGGDLPFFTTTAGSTFGSGIVLAPTYGSGATVANTGTADGGWAYSFYDTGGNGIGVYGDTGSINDGEWHHLVYVFDRAAGATVYLDGVGIPSDAVRYHHSSRQAGTTATAAGNIDTGNAATIGQDPTGTYGESGSGDIDDLGVWKKALTPLEIASIYIAGVSNSLSFTSAPFTLSEVKSGNSVTLRWDVGVLQQATAVGGPYTDVQGASSPLTVTPSAAAPTKYYRIRL